MTKDIYQKTSISKGVKAGIFPISALIDGGYKRYEKEKI